MALELRPNCEWCDIDLPLHSPQARICTYECTFCADCAARQPPSTKRHALSHSHEDITAHVARIEGIAPEDR